MNTGRILLVEDDPGIRKFLRVALEAQGFGLEEAASGRAASRKPRPCSPTSSCSTSACPDMDGKAGDRRASANGRRCRS